MASEKSCTKCKEVKPFAAFSSRRDGHSKLHSWCRECEKEYNRSRTRPKETPEHRKERVLKSRYGITTEQWQAMFDAQNGCCKICGRHQSLFKKALHVDHNHDTGEVRGLLCSKCNAVLGWLETHDLFGQFTAYCDTCQEKK